MLEGEGTATAPTARKAAAKMWESIVRGHWPPRQRATGSYTCEDSRDVSDGTPAHFAD